MTDGGTTRAAAVTGAVPSRVAVPFESFYRGDREGLRRAVAFAIGDHALAGEAVDEAMTRAYQRWTRVGGYDDPAGWVYRVAVNWARSRWRRARRLVAIPAPESAAARPSDLPDPALWAAVAALPDGQRDAIVLRFVLDWPHERIAAALDITPGSARSRVTRGLQRLRADLEVGT